MAQDEDFENQNAAQSMYFTEINLKDSVRRSSDNVEKEDIEDTSLFEKISGEEFRANALHIENSRNKNFSFLNKIKLLPAKIKSLKPAYTTGVILSLLWTIAAIYYLVGTDWWQKQFSVSPTEFVGVVAAMFSPIALLWLVIGYFEKNSDLRKQVSMLEKYMNKLVNPDDSDSAYTEALTKTLSEQVINLKQTFADVNQVSQGVSKELKMLIAEFKLLASKVDSDVVFSIKDLTEGVKQMLDSANMASGRAKEAAAFLSEQINILNTTSEKAVVMVADHAASISENIGVINSAYEGLDKQKEEMVEVFRQNAALLNATSEHIKNRVEESIHTVEGEIDLIRKSSDSILNEAAGMALKLSNKTEDLANVFISQSNILDASTNEVKNKAEILVSSFSDKTKGIIEECENAVRHLNIVGKEISEQCDGTFDMVDRSVAKISGITKVLDDNSSFVSAVTEKACADIEKSSSFMENSLDKAQNSLGLLAVKTAEITDAATQRCQDILGISDAVCGKVSEVTDTVCDKISAVSNTAITHTKNLDNSISGMSSAFAELLAIVKSESEKLSDLSALVVSQSRMAEASLIEQQKHISNSAARIEELKGELKLEILDLTKAVSIVDESSTASIGRLKDNMAGLMGLSDEVISKTTYVSSAISEGTENLDRSSAKALNTVEKIAGALKQEGDKLAFLGDRLEVQTTGLEKQANAISDAVEKTENYAASKSRMIMESTEKAGAILQSQADIFSDRMKDLEKRTNTVENALKKQLEIVNAAYDEIIGKINVISDTIGNNADAFAGSVESAGKASESIAKMFQDVIKETENVTQRSIEEAKTVSDKMKIVLGEVNNAAYDSAQELLNAGDVFVKRADMMAKASESAAGKIKAIMEEMK